MSWSIWNAPSDRDYQEQQSPYGPEPEDPDNLEPWAWSDSDPLASEETA